MIGSEVLRKRSSVTKEDEFHQALLSASSPKEEQKFHFRRGSTGGIPVTIDSERLGKRVEFKKPKNYWHFAAGGALGLLVLLLMFLTFSTSNRERYYENKSDREEQKAKMYKLKAELASVRASLKELEHEREIAKGAIAQATETIATLRRGHTKKDSPSVSQETRDSVLADLRSKEERLSQNQVDQQADLERLLATVKQLEKQMRADGHRKAMGSLLFSMVPSASEDEEIIQADPSEVAPIAVDDDEEVITADENDSGPDADNDNDNGGDDNVEVDLKKEKIRQIPLPHKKEDKDQDKAPQANKGKEADKKEPTVEDLINNPEALFARLGGERRHIKDLRSKLSKFRSIKNTGRDLARV